MTFKALLEEQCGQLCLGEGPDAGRKSLMQKKAEKQNDVQNSIYFSATTFYSLYTSFVPLSVKTGHNMTCFAFSLQILFAGDNGFSVQNCMIAL